MTTQTISTSGSDHSPQMRRVRWIGVVAIVAAGLGIVGILLSSVGRFGVFNLRATWLDTLPWVVVLVLAICVHRLQGRSSSASALGLAAFAATFAGPALVAALVGLRWTGEPVDLGIPRVVFDDATVDHSVTITRLGLLFIILATVLLFISIWVAVSRLASIRGVDIPKSPYRVEVLALILVVILVALLVPVSTSIGVVGVLPYSSEQVLLLSWVVPLVLVLAFALRSPGQGSIWVISGLAIAFVFEPIIRVLALVILSRLEWADGGIEEWLQPIALGGGRGSAPMLATPWLLIPIAVLCIVVLLWNSQLSPVAQRTVDRSPSAQIDPWAGTAFVLSYVPLISFPAIILGHVSYERIVADGERERGRVLAAAAIFFGMLNIALIALFVGGALDTATKLLDRG